MKRDLNPQGISHAGAPAIPLADAVGHSRENKRFDLGSQGLAVGSFGWEPHERTARRPRGGPICPDQDCGGRLTKSVQSGRDLRDRPLRQRRCTECGAEWVTVEEIIRTREGDLAKFSEVDVEHKRQAREWKRRANGWSAKGSTAKPRAISGSMTIRRGR